MLRKKKNSTSETPVQEIKKDLQEKVLEVNASMTGTLTFKDPVNLRIDGNFEGSLDTKGKLTIGENAAIQANIVGETIVVAGRVTGDIVATKSLELVPPALVVGNVNTPSIGITPGAILEGQLRMASSKKEGRPAVSEGTSAGQELSVQEVAAYLEVEPRVVEDWARQGRIPSRRRGDSWTFDRTRVEKWVADEKVKV